MNVIKNATEGISFPIHSYQQTLIDKFSAGFKPGEMILYSSGRQSGKSMLNAYYGSTGIKSLYYTKLSDDMKPAPKYKFSRSKWYEAEFSWGQQTEVLEWCKQQFGPQPKFPDAWSRWHHRYQEKIYFRDEKDYAWFMLRWS